MTETGGRTDNGPWGRRLTLLQGVKIVDLTHFLAGPFSTMILADLGATVVKVEQLQGDSTREQPPHFFHGDSAYFLAVNRNKSSIALDIRSESGQRIIRRLIEEADVVIDNLRPPQREALHLSYAHLRRINPRVVHCSLTGFGSDGPYSNRPAYDIIVEALGGIMSLTGPEGGPSVRAGVPIGDITAGLFAAIGILAGLQRRAVTGEGMHVDVGMLDCQVSLLSYLAQYFFADGYVATHQGRAHVSIPTYNAFATGDGGEIVIAANTQGMWVRLCKVLGREDLLADGRFIDKPTRLKHRQELVAILSAEFSRWKLADIYDVLVSHEVPAAPINTIDAALEDPQVRYRDMVVRAPHRDGGSFLTLGSPLKCTEAAGEVFDSPPALGGQSVAVLRELGYGDGEIDAFIAEGCVGIDGATA